MTNHHHWRLMATALLLGLSALGSVSAQEASDNTQTAPKVVQIVHTETAPVIDGRIDEAVWSQAATVEDFHQILPIDHGQPTEPTYVYLLYDDDFLYVAARMPRGNPETLRANVLRQGAVIWGDDLFAVMLAPFNDKRSGYRFQINANAVRMEALYQDTTRQLWAWTGIWQAKAARDQSGWTAEMAIPFKTLSFNPQNEAWGINFRRELGVTDERQGWVSFNRNQDPRNSGLVTGLRDLELGRGLDIVPSLSLRQVKEYAPVGRNEFETEPSLDVYYKLSPSLNSALTLNTDFSATEVDDRQVDLTRFGLFFPEKRSFFLRDSDIFRFGRLGIVLRGGGAPAGSFSRPSQENGQPFFSRRIGLSESGAPVDLNFGGKLSGRIGRWNLGALAIRQDKFGDVDATDLFVGRAVINVLQESSLGLIVTDGDPRSNLSNTLAGADFRYSNTQLPGGRSLEGEAWIQKSTTQGADGDDGAWGLGLRSPNTAGWRGGLGIKELQANFNPALGYVNRSGVRDQTAELGYTWRHRHAYLRATSTGLDAQRIDAIDGGLQTEILNFRLLEVQTNRRDRLRLRHFMTKEVLTAPFVIWEQGSEQIVIPTGEYSFDETALVLTGGPVRKVFGNFGVRKGDFYNGERLRLTGTINWRPSPHFTGRLKYEVNDVELPTGNFVARLIQLRTDIVFSATLSWSTLLQYDNISDTIGINSRIHWIPEAGREAFVVLNHNMQDFDRSDSFHSTAADLTLKYNYTFRF